MRRFKDKNFLLPIVQPFLHENKNPRQLSSATIPKCCLKKKIKFMISSTLKITKQKRKRKSMIKANKS